MALVKNLTNTIADTGYVTSGDNPATGEPYEYTLNVCSNSSIACLDPTTDAAAACQRNTGNNSSFVLGQSTHQMLR